MKKQKIMSALLGLCMLLSLLLVPVQTVQAEQGNAAVQNARNGVVQVAVNVVVDKQEMGFLTVGSGFVVGTPDSPQTVITNYHVTHSVVENDIRALLGLGSKEKVELTPQIVVRRDLRIDAEVYKESEVGDFAILKLEQPIYDRSPLTLGDSDTVETTVNVYALGFPGIVQDIQTDSKYTFDDVNVTEGIVSKVSDVALVSNPIPCITHSARVSEGNSGGPLVNSNGAVVGVNTFISDDENGNNDYFYATQINEIRSVLNALGVDYMSEDAADAPAATTGVVDAQPADDTEDAEPTEEPTPEPTEEPNAYFDELGDLIDKAGAIDLTVMTDDSVSNLDSAMKAAKDAWNNTASTDEELKAAIDDLQKAMDGLVEKPTGLSPAVIIGIAAAIIVVIIVVVVLIVVSSGKKKKKIEAERERQRRVNVGGTGNMPKPPVSPVPGAQPMGGQPQWNQQRPNPMPMGSDGSEETGVLNDGSSETTVLGGQNIPTAYLIRKKNNERITISKAIFKLGKERRKVDYCIADNTNVSRAHADIVYRNGEFYVVDNNATNGTTVNGASVAAGQERKIANNDIIKLADEEFQFRTF